MISQSYISNSLNSINKPLKPAIEPPKQKKITKETNDKKDKTLNNKALDEEYGEVKSISKDGDTLRVKEKEVKKDTENDKDIEKEKATNLKVYSDEELEAMYRSGKISGEAYAIEIKKRELEEDTEENDDSKEKTTEELIENIETNSKKMAVYESIRYQNELDLVKNKIIISEDSSDKIPVKERLKAMDSVKNVIKKPDQKHEVKPKEKDQSTVLPKKAIVGKVILP